MPRNVRNVWHMLEVDGRTSKVETGPKNGNGGSYERVLFREEGDISPTELRIEVRVSDMPNGKEGEKEIFCHVYVVGPQAIKDGKEQEIKLKFKR